MAKECRHLDFVRTDRLRSRGCEECLKLGDIWVYRRLCRTFGQVGWRPSRQRTNPLSDHAIRIKEGDLDLDGELSIEVDLAAMWIAARMRG